MATSKYFDLSRRTSEQNLLDDLNREAIQIHGVDVLYLPRHLQKEDLIFGEDVLSKFDDYYDIELYVKNVDGFDGSGDVFRQLGLQVGDEATFIVSQTRFREVIGDELQPPRPREGDLIFFPLNGALFEIKYVDNESIFYQLGNTYVYEMKVRQYVFSHEDVQTGINEIDEAAEDVSFSFTLTLGIGSGTYQDKEYIYQGTSLLDATAKARIIQSGNPSGTVQIRDLVGAFVTGADAIGETSGAAYEVTAVNDMDLLQDGSAQNKPIQDETADFLDFDEKNPFSENDP